MNKDERTPLEQAQEAYIEFLGIQVQELSLRLANHGWRCNQTVYKEGVRLRAVIEEAQVLAAAPTPEDEDDPFMKRFNSPKSASMLAGLLSSANDILSNLKDAKPEAETPQQYAARVLEWAEPIYWFSMINHLWVKKNGDPGIYTTTELIQQFDNQPKTEK
jgi:hypothetical protein